MISDFTKRQRAEKAERSQFKEGTMVAIVNHHWDRRIEGKRMVVKVLGNGNFKIADREGKVSDSQWTPDWQGTSARLAGQQQSRIRHSEHLEIWTPDHAAEIVETRAKADRYRRVAAVSERLQERRAHIDEHTLRALEAALGLSTAAPGEPEVD